MQNVVSIWISCKLLGVFFFSFLEKYVTEMQASFVCSGWLNDARRGKQIFRYFAAQYFWMQDFAMDLSKMPMDMYCSMYFSPFAKQHQAEVLPRFQSLFKLLL